MPLSIHCTPPEGFLLVMPTGSSRSSLGGIFFKNVVGHWDRDTPYRSVSCLSRFMSQDGQDKCRVLSCLSC